ncbi:MAG: O-antigen ligase family protein, partial [Chloroflexi bacterium]|nr:O-antigen ligase family protein [Chloroflexota bacterium]
RYVVAPLPSLHANEMITVNVQTQNIGQQTWPTQGTQPVYLFYHWSSADGATVYVADGLHTPLPREIAPGETITLAASVQTPAQAGDYMLAWDMLREGTFWFSTLGAPVYPMPVTILAGGQPSTASTDTRAAAAAPLHLERGDLWRAALRMVAAHPILGVGAGNFRLVLGNYLGLSVWDNRLHANNTYLEMFADTGLLGGAAFMLLALTILWHAARALRAARAADDEVWIASSAAALCAFCIHGVVDYFLEFTATYLLFWIALAVLVALAAPAKERA